MGTLVKWKAITTEASYDTTRIYRSTTESGTYTLIASQVISDTSYYDADGTTTSWYKIQFYDSVGASVSDYSTARQSGTWYGYCTVEDIRRVTNIKSTDVTDTVLATLIEFAGQELNANINIYHEEEGVSYIDDVKSNKIDGSNATYYTKNYPIGDANDSFTVTTSDITVYTYNASTDPTTKSQVTVSSITPNTGQFVLATAPTSNLLVKVTYNHVQRSVSDPHSLIKSACILLTAAWAYSKLNIGKADRFRMGNLTVFRDTDAYIQYYKKYTAILAQINDRSITDIKEAEDLI